MIIDRALHRVRVCAYGVGMSQSPAATVTPELPKWDLSVYFKSLDDPALDEAIKAFQGGLDELERELDQYAGPDKPPHPETGPDSAAPALEAIIDRFNALGERAMLLRSYIHGHITTNSRDERAQARNGELQPLMTRFNTLNTRLKAWIGTLPIDALIERPGVLEAHAFALRNMHAEASRLMGAEEEALAAQLAETGGTAWANLYGNVSSQIEVELDGAALPMSAVRNLAHDPDPGTRHKAYRAELEAWRKHEVVIAAALNSIKGESSLLNRKRGWGGLLNEALFRANMDQVALDAMMNAARDAFPVFRRYLRAKAARLGHRGGLPWSDLFAPVGARGSWSYEEAMSFIERHFRGFSGKLGDFAVRAFEENWIDAAPAGGKRDGAFCMGTRGDESRILMNFKPAFGSVATLAHELGHGYHNVCLAERTPLQRQTPMTLAETASIFCETIIKRAALRETEAAEQLSILEASLQGANQVVVDITSRFEFESEVLKRRPQRELAAREFCEIMLEAQRNTYGDGLDADQLHGYMWAVKPHYYAWRSFYNFPYMFGLLFGLGLYAIYQKSPEDFYGRYDELLGATGLDDAAALTAGFGIDIRDQGFWDGSLGVIEEDVARFEQLCREVPAGADE